MKRWMTFTLLAGALCLGALGCGGNNNNSFTVTVTPSATSVVLNTSSQFSALINGNSNQTVTWALACAVGVSACGTINSTTGLYTAPGSLPSTPTAIVTAISQADTSITAQATITIISGITAAITPGTASIGTGETFTFTAAVSNPGCNSQADPTCLEVTWAISTTNDGSVGSIDASGDYTAPATVPTSPTITITATSVKDTSVIASATVTIVTAADPTVSAVSPGTTGLGSVFQDIFISGTKFLATTVVYINGAALPAANVVSVSTSGLVATVPAQTLASPPTSGILQVTASRQNGIQQPCTPDITACQIVVLPTHPVVLGPSPESIPQGSAGSLNFNVNGGFFGTTQSPAISATYDGQARTASVLTTSDECGAASNLCTARQATVVIGGPSNSSDFGVPGLHQVAIHSSTSPTQFEAANLAVQPNVGSNPPTPVAGSPFTVGTAPVDVAIDKPLGLAVVANSGSNDVTLIDMTQSPPAIVAKSICTGTLTPVSPCPASGPQTVAAAHILATGQDIALVANATAKNIAVINLTTKATTALIPLTDAPAGVGINGVTGRALVSINTRGYGVLLDLTQATPAIAGVVTITTGPNSHVAVDSYLDWAVATPGGGGVGTLSIVNLNQEFVNNIVSVSRSQGIVTATVQDTTGSTTQSPLSVQVGDAVWIQGVSVGSDTTSFNGIYTVTSVGPLNAFAYSEINNNPPDVALSNATGSVNYSPPVATAAVTTSITGIGIDEETKEAVLTDATSSTTQVYFFRLLDQTVTSLSLPEAGIIAGAFNPLTNIALVVNQTLNQLSVIDPTAPARLPTSNSTFATGNRPIAVAVDSASNQALVVNQTDNTVSIYSLGAIRSVAITDIQPKTFELDSTLSAAPQTPGNLILTIAGAGFTASSVPRLDGTPISVISASNRELVASVPGSMLTSAHEYAVDVLNPGIVSNAEGFGVIQSVDVSTGTGCTSAPLPTGIAVDAQQGRAGLAVVTLFGCSTVAVVDLSTGTGTTIAVGANPQGVALLPNIHSAVIADSGANEASVVDYLADEVTGTVSVGTAPTAVAVDPATSEAVVTNSVDNTISLLSVSPSNAAVETTVSTGQYPIAAAFNFLTHEVAVGAAAGNVINVGDPNSGSLSATFATTLPTKILFDPSANTFLVDQSTVNEILILDPTTQQQTNFQVGINPTDMAYNYLTSTLITTNTLSGTLSVIDFLDSTSSTTDRTVRAVLTLPPPPPGSTLALTGALQFGVDIVPVSNIAVVADTANGRVLMIPLPN